MTNDILCFVWCIYELNREGYGNKKKSEKDITLLHYFYGFGLGLALMMRGRVRNYTNIHVTYVKSTSLFIHSFSRGFEMTAAFC